MATSAIVCEYSFSGPVLYVPTILQLPAAQPGCPCHLHLLSEAGLLSRPSELQHLPAYLVTMQIDVNKMQEVLYGWFEPHYNITGGFTYKQAFFLDSSLSMPSYLYDSPYQPGYILPCATHVLPLVCLCM